MEILFFFFFLILRFRLYLTHFTGALSASERRTGLTRGEFNGHGTFHCRTCVHVYTYRYTRAVSSLKKESSSVGIHRNSRRGIFDEMSFRLFARKIIPGRTFERRNLILIWKLSVRAGRLGSVSTPFPRLLRDLRARGALRKKTNGPSRAG